jgi:hypothetical protein
MDDSAAETVLDALDGLYLWRKPKPGMTLFGSYVGCVLVTSRRFLFLSTGGGVGRALGLSFAGGVPVGLTLGQIPAAQVDLSSLGNEGSVSGRLEYVTSARVERRWDLSNYLAVESAGGGGLPASCSVMTRFGRGRTRLLALHQTLESARAQAVVRRRG